MIIDNINFLKKIAFKPQNSYTRAMNLALLRNVKNLKFIVFTENF